MANKKPGFTISIDLDALFAGTHQKAVAGSYDAS